MNRPCDRCGEPSISACGSCRAVYCMVCLIGHTGKACSIFKEVNPTYKAQLEELVGNFPQKLKDVDPFCNMCSGAGSYNNKTCPCRLDWCTGCKTEAVRGLHFSCQCACH